MAIARIPSISKHMVQSIAMPSHPPLQIHIDAALQKQAAAVLAGMGLSLSDAVHLLLTHVVQDKRLPFAALVPGATTLAALKEVRSGCVTKAKNSDLLFCELNHLYA